jgi:hypothetical protein
MTDNTNEVTVDNSVLILIDHQPWVACGPGRVSARAFGSPPGPYDQRVVDDVRSTPPVDPALIDELERGDLYPSWDYVILADVIGGRKTGV